MIASAVSALLAAMLAALLLTPIAIVIAKKMKLRQTILEYVDNHAAKSGTPTMGGIAIVTATSFAALIFTKGERSFALVCIAVMAGYGIIGFLDDFIKVWFKQNKGLSPWQKIVFQVAVSVCVSLFAYFNPYIGDKQFAPITFYAFRFGPFAVPYYIVVFLAAGNAVNLIDGLDGLAVNVTKNYLICFILLMYITSTVSGVIFSEHEQDANIIITCCALVGALIGFGCYNCYPAKIFMGDTGSLALGGALAAIAVFTGMSITLLILGVMYVVTALSVIIQVAYYKRTKKRVFLMSPIHHHFERKGVPENRIVNVYGVITLMMGGVLILGVLLRN